MRTDLTVFAKDYPEPRLMVEVRSAVSSPPEQDPAVRHLVRRMWGANCHFGLIMTPTKTYVLRDDFSAPGLESIRVSDVFATGALLGRLSWPGVEAMSEEQLEWLAREWLERLTSSYEAALPEDPDMMRAFFPDLVGAVADGRVVTMAAVS
jgi:hypothetical protein